jgi:L,D-transpeptidase YcbB
MLLSSHLYYGKVDPEKEGAGWKMPRKEPEIQLDRKLEEVLTTNNMAQELDLLAPRYQSYWMMKKELAFFIELNRQSWPVMFSGLPIKPGVSNQLIPQIRIRLINLRYPLSDSISLNFDKELENQIKAFQDNWGLNADGVIGKGTMNVLNSIPDNLMNKLKVNMERFRWLPLHVPDKYIIVNIANFRLDMIEGEDTLLSMRAIVGKQYRETPVFKDQMTYIVFSPSWTVPPTILKKDVIPELLKGPEYLTKKRMNLFRMDGSMIAYSDIDWSKITQENFHYMVRQDPGPDNALGKVKFMFPNTYDVYIHDTPTRGFFARDDRALSSGCVRIEKPFDLAVKLMSDMPEWSPEQIQIAMQKNIEQKVKLKTPIDVVLIYLTAWTDGKGQVQFRKDVYKQDDTVLKALNKKIHIERE